MTQAIPDNLAHWLPTAGLALVAVAAALVLYLLLVRLAVRMTRRRRVARRFIIDCVRPAGALLALAILQSLLQGKHDGLAWLAGVRHISGLALILVFTWAAITVVNAMGDLIVGLNPAVEGRHHVARKLETQTRFLTRALIVLIAIIGLASALMTFPSIRQLGTSLLASAGIGGVILGFAARPVLGNLLAGLQIAMTQPFKIEDVLWIKGEWCWVEEVTTTYVVLRVWDLRRLVLPLQWFVDNPFENWSRHSSRLFGTVFLWVDYRAPVAELRAEYMRLLGADPRWDREPASLQVVDASDKAIQLRFLMSARDSMTLWHLRCDIREAMIEHIQHEHPDSLPVYRALWNDDRQSGPTYSGSAPDDVGGSSSPT